MTTGRTAWAEMSDSPARNVSGSNPDAIASLEVRAADVAIKALEARVRLLPSRTDPAYDAAEKARLEKELDDSVEAFMAIEEAALANAAARSPPLPDSPTFDPDRPTDQKMSAVYQRTKAYVRKEVRKAFNIDGLSARHVGEADGADPGAPSGKLRLPSPPTFSGVRGDGKLTVDIWLMQFLDWCELAHIALDKGVQCAVQCLEGQSVQNWYNLERQLIANGASVDSWDTFQKAMIKQCADISPHYEPACFHQGVTAHSLPFTIAS